MNLRNLGLKPKIAVGFGSLLAIIAGMGLVGIGSAMDSMKLSREMRTDAAKKHRAHLIQEAFLLERLGTRDVLMGRDSETTHLFEHGEADFRRAMEELKPLISTEEDRNLYARVELAAADYTSRNDSIVARYRAGDSTEALRLFKDHDALVIATALTSAVNDMATSFERQMQDALARHTASDAWTKQFMLLLALAGVVLGLAIAHITAYSILRGNRRILRMIDAISSNNLMIADMEVSSTNEMGHAAMGLNSMKNSLREVILSIATTAEEVSGSSRDISATASQAAGSAENQKQQIEQIATTMQEMAATVREVSHHAVAAAHSAECAANSAREGGRSVENVITRMRAIAIGATTAATNVERLGTRSNEIGRIVGVIDNIAEQTNLLALNAAIEAARAGEQGRGFAVVASEVRRLAERTTSATGEIASVIHDFQAVTAALVKRIRADIGLVERGVEVTALAGESVQKIIDEAANVGTMVAQIASAATQQATATEQVNASMSEISELVTEAADGSQLSARACEQLFDLALGLQTTVDRFDVGQRRLQQAKPTYEGDLGTSHLRALAAMGRIG